MDGEAKGERQAVDGNLPAAAAGFSQFLAICAPSAGYGDNVTSVSSSWHVQNLQA